MRKPVEPRAWLLDIEGVLVRDKRYRAVPGAVEWFAALIGSGLPYCLVSNNTTHRPADLVADLNRAGFPVTLDRLVGALGLGLAWLRERSLSRLLWLGTPDLAGYLREEGFDLVEDGPCEAVVLGANTRLTPADLDRALPALLDDGASLVCLHRNRFFLDGEGRRRLGPGAWAAALEALGGTGKSVILGKPAEPIYREALKRVGVPAREALFISDDPEADLVTAARLGLGTAFVLSGKYEDHRVLERLDQEDWPDIVCAGLGDLDRPRR